MEDSEDLNTYWKEIRNILQEPVEEIVLVTNRRNMKWMAEEIMNLLADKRGAKQSQNGEQYKQVEKQIKWEGENGKEKWFNERCREIETRTKEIHISCMRK